MSRYPLHCEVAVVGAGPYGLAVAASLKEAGIETRVFGDAMSFWRDNMPKGMRLRSSLIASDIGAPKAKLSFHDYAEHKAERFVYPIPLEEFVNYGEWFQSRAVTDLDRRGVACIEEADAGFVLTLADGERVMAQRVVIATGLINQQFVPAAFAGLTRDLVSHSCQHSDLSQFRGKRVAVVGRGQSACESAAILNDAGADVTLVCRGDVHWLGSVSTDTSRPNTLLWRAHELLASKSGVGPFPFNWLAEFPDIVRRLPTDVRLAFNKRCLRPGATSWLKPQFDGVTMAAGKTIERAHATKSGVHIDFADGASEFDHVLLATGYHIDIGKIGVLAPALLDRIGCANGSPLLRTGFESSVRGLHFVGASAVRSYGPLMRFVAGSGFAARHVTRTVAANRRPLRREDLVRSYASAFVNQEIMSRP